MSDDIRVTDEMISRFLSWELPRSVRSDMCVALPDYQGIRYGTSLLTHAEAKAMLEHVLADHFIELDDDDTLREMMADILRRTAIVLKGEPGQLQGHGWQDLPEVAAALLAAPPAARVVDKLNRFEELRDAVIALRLATEIADRGRFTHAHRMPTRDEQTAVAQANARVNAALDTQTAQPEAEVYLIEDVAPDGHVIGRELQWNDHCCINAERHAQGFDVRAVPLYRHRPQPVTPDFRQRSIEVERHDHETRAIAVAVDIDAGIAEFVEELQRDFAHLGLRTHASCQGIEGRYPPQVMATWPKRLDAELRARHLITNIGECFGYLHPPGTVIPKGYEDSFAETTVSDIEKYRRCIERMIEGNILDESADEFIRIAESEHSDMLAELEKYRLAESAALRAAAGQSPASS